MSLKESLFGMKFVSNNHTHSCSNVWKFVNKIFLSNGFSICDRICQCFSNFFGSRYSIKTKWMKNAYFSITSARRISSGSVTLNKNAHVTKILTYWTRNTTIDVFLLFQRIPKFQFFYSYHVIGDVTSVLSYRIHIHTYIHTDTHTHPFFAYDKTPFCIPLSNF